VSTVYVYPSSLPKAEIVRAAQILFCLGGDRVIYINTGLFGKGAK
jgi:hypothetical protein